MKREEVKDIVRRSVGKTPQDYGVDTWKQLIEKLTDEILNVDNSVCQYTNDGEVAKCEIWQTSARGCGECALLGSRVRIIEERQAREKN